MKSLKEFISESSDNIKDMTLTYKEFLRDMIGNVWGDSGKYSRTMPGLYHDTLYEWSVRVEDLAELMSPDVAEIFLNTINSSYFKKNQEKLVFYVSKKSDKWKMRDIGVASKLRDKNIPLAFSRDGSYPCFYAGCADNFAYWFKDNLKNCIKYIEKKCIE